MQVAEQPQADQELGAYRVYMADRKVEIARAQAETSLAEDQRTALSANRETSRLDARTREADAAHVATANSEQQAAELQRQIDVLQAKPTDRGLIVTLGDVLFDTGKASLKAGTTSNLNKLVAFLNEYSDRTVLIEGYTDSVGSRRLQPGAIRATRRLSEVVSGWTGYRLNTSFRIRKGRERSSREQRFRSRPAAEPSRRGDHQQSASGVEVAKAPQPRLIGRDPAHRKVRGIALGMDP